MASADPASPRNLNDEVDSRGIEKRSRESTTENAQIEPDEQDEDAELLDSAVDSPAAGPPDYDEALTTSTKTLSSARRRFRATRGVGKTARRRVTAPRKKGDPGHMWIKDGPDDKDNEEVTPAPSLPPEADTTRRGSNAQGTVISTRRQANGTVSSVYSGQKVRHIKKIDGEPLWRKDIQLRFLELVVNDETPCFTRVGDSKKNMPFVDIYIDAVIRSSRTSKILRDRLGSDREAAVHMAMICLLVNVGRMNTTLNFFPEMRAQLRTYHSIPSLQAYKSQRDYKPLQDAPRLKSILKGACEDDPNEPKSFEELRERGVPRTNPVNMIFVLSHFMPKISETHLPHPIDFFDLFVRSSVSSESRARAFLWLMWWYLESSFTKEDALNNPFGPGTYPDGVSEQDADALPTKVPELTFLSDEDGDAENVDTEFEYDFADKMREERRKILLEDVNDPEHVTNRRWRKGLGVSDEPGRGKGKRTLDDLATSDAESVEPPLYGVLKPPKTNDAETPDPSEAWRNGTDPSARPMDARRSRVSGPQSSHLRHGETSEDRQIAVTPSGGARGGRGGRNTRGARGGQGDRATTFSGRRITKTSRAQALDRGTPDTVDTPQPTAAFMSHYSRTREDSEAINGRALDDGPAAKVDGRRRPRPLTQHQRALEHHRRERVEYTLALRKRQIFEKLRSDREDANWLIRAMRRIDDMQSLYDSEEDADGDQWGLSGMVRKIGVSKRRKIADGSDLSHHHDSEKENEDDIDDLEVEDYGEEAEEWIRVCTRAKRRLDKWEGDRDARIYAERHLPPEQRTRIDYGPRPEKLRPVIAPPAPDRTASAIPETADDQPSPRRRATAPRRSNLLPSRARRGSRRTTGTGRGARRGVNRDAASRLAAQNVDDQVNSEVEEKSAKPEPEDLNDEIERRLLAEHDTESDLPVDEEADADQVEDDEGDEGDEDHAEDDEDDQGDEDEDEDEDGDVEMENAEDDGEIDNDAESELGDGVIERVHPFNEDEEDAGEDSEMVQDD